MKKYTFIASYDGGTYISQYCADDIKSALWIWVDGLPKKIFTVYKRQKIKQEIMNLDNDPTPIDTTENVWCAFYSVGKHFLLLNIVQTV